LQTIVSKDPRDFTLLRSDAHHLFIINYLPDNVSGVFNSCDMLENVLSCSKSQSLAQLLCSPNFKVTRSGNDSRTQLHHQHRIA
jgi:hypothetical protein